MRWQQGPLKHWLDVNDSGVWGDDPDRLDDVEILRSTDITLDGGWDIHDPALRSVSPVERAAKRLDAGDLVVVKSSGSEAHLGKTAIVTTEVAARKPCFANFVQRLRPSPTADSRYVWYVLNAKHASDEMAILGNTTTGLRNLNGTIIGQVTFPGAPLAEQRAIADFLDAETARIDALVEKKRRLVERLNQRLSVEHERLVLGQDQAQESSTNGGFYGATAWPETALRHLSCEVQTGPFGSQLHADDYVKDGWPVVNPSNIVAGRIIALPEVTIDDETRTRLARHSLKPGDIVFGRRGEMGRAGLVSDQETGWICGTGSLRLRLTGDLLLPEYLKLLLETGAAKRYFQLSSVGSTMENLNTEILLALPVLVPPIKEQKRVVNVISRSRAHNLKLETKLNKSINLLTEHRQALITAAVTGQIGIPKSTVSQ